MTAVLTAVGRWDSQVATALEASNQVQIARRCADLADLLATAAAGLGAAAMVSDDLRGLDLSAVARLRAVGMHVVGLSAPDDEGAERRLRQMGITTVVPAGSALPLLEAALLSSSATTHLGPGSGRDGWPEDPVTQNGQDVPGGDAAAYGDDGPGSLGRIIAVWGPTGAPGRTTVAVNIAAELAALGVSTALVDADTYGGSVAQALSLLDEAPGIAAAARAADQGTLDLPALARLAPEVGRGMRVITGIPKAERWPEIRPAALERILALSRSLAEVVVVDCGFNLEDDEELSYDTVAPRRNAATLTTLSLADEVLAIGTCDPVGLQRLVRGFAGAGHRRLTQAPRRRQPGAVALGRLPAGEPGRGGPGPVRRCGAGRLRARRPAGAGRRHARGTHVGRVCAGVPRAQRPAGPRGLGGRAAGRVPPPLTLTALRHDAAERPSHRGPRAPAGQPAKSSERPPTV
jgi:Mrp family chromosome partitioning ATPase